MRQSHLKLVIGHTYSLTPPIKYLIRDQLTIYAQFCRKESDILVRAICTEQFVQLGIKRGS